MTDLLFCNHHVRQFLKKITCCSESSLTIRMKDFLDITTKSDGSFISASKIILTRTFPIGREMVNSISITDDDVTFSNSGDQFHGTIYEVEKSWRERNRDIHLRQSPHTLRFLVIWIRVAWGWRTKFHAMASFSLCPQSAEATVSFSASVRVIHVESYSCPWAINSFDNRASSA